MAYLKDSFLFIYFQYFRQSWPCQRKSVEFSKVFGAAWKGFWVNFVNSTLMAQLERNFINPTAKISSVYLHIFSTHLDRWICKFRPLIFLPNSNNSWQGKGYEAPCISCLKPEMLSRWSTTSPASTTRLRGSPHFLLR